MLHQMSNHDGIGMQSYNYLVNRNCKNFANFNHSQWGWSRNKSKLSLCRESQLGAATLIINELRDGVGGIFCGITM